MKNTIQFDRFVFEEVVHQHYKCPELPCIYLLKDCNSWICVYNDKDDGVGVREAVHVSCRALTKAEAFNGLREILLDAGNRVHAAARLMEKPTNSVCA